MIRTAMLVAALAIAAFATGPGRARAEEPPRALVLEYADPWTHATGARELLEGAGFRVRSLSLHQSPKHAPGDLVVIGSFASENPEYAKYMESYGRDLAEFVTAGGVVLELTQADQTEGEPAFLPEGLSAARGDRDYREVRVLAPEHPLLAGLPRKDDRLDLPRHSVFKTLPNWESLVWQAGFRVLAASDELARNPALIEGAAGRGRVILTSLCLDKVVDSEGDAVADERWVAAGRTFFANLAAYVRSVRDGTAPAVPADRHPDAKEPEEPAGPPVEIRWRLAPSDLALYERSVVTRKGDRIYRRGGKPATVHGHDLRDAGQYFPSPAVRDDLPAMLALRLPPAGQATGELDTVVRIRRSGDVRIRGTASATQRGSKEARIRGDYEFATRSPPTDDSPSLRAGAATVDGTFDRKAGVVTRAFVRITYKVVQIGQAMKTLDEEYEFRLEELKRTRYPGFQSDVDAGIDRGTAWLQKRQRPDGTFPPHGNWEFGTTALGVFTLVSMGIPLDDPGVEKALAWMTAREPERTYERALGLMALERAYTPPAEAAAEWRGEPVKHRRDLPPDRRAWCERTAEALIRSAPSPGAWCYPQTNPRSLLRLDTSNTQYAILGLRAASRMGIEVDESIWLGVVRYFEQVREAKGPRGLVVLVPEGTRDPAASAGARRVREVAGFRYSPIAPMDEVRGSMTAAGIASLGIARSELERAGSRKLTPSLVRDIESMTLGAWARLDSFWTVDRHPGLMSNQWYYYWLYSLERAGILSRVKLVGGKDWYFEGAVQILARQKKDGAWSEPGGTDLPETCFALLFLKRATPPISPSGR